VATGIIRKDASNRDYFNEHSGIRISGVRTLNAPKFIDSMSSTILTNFVLYAVSI
ncbi:21732_t:CDS:1, partial [Racocetra persica]